MLVLPDTEFSTPVATLALRKVVFEGAGGTDAPLAATWMCREVGTGVPPFRGSRPTPWGTGTRYSGTRHRLVPRQYGGGGARLLRSRR